MLKGKSTLKLMIPINILIWGFVLYKVYSYFKEDDMPFEVKTSLSKVELQTEDSSEYILSLNYEDPFLKAESEKVVHKQITPSTPIKPLKNSKPVQPEAKMEIKYLGVISNQSSGIVTALVLVNGKSVIMKKGDIIEGVKLEALNSQCLTVKIGKEKLVIQKS